MHKNSLLFETHYLRNERRFISECQKRNLNIDTHFLKEYQKYSLFQPVLEVDGESYYDAFQIPLVASIYNRAKNPFKEIDGRVAEIKASLRSIESVLPLLYQIRYFYHHKIHSFLTSGILPPFRLTKEQEKAYSSKFTEIFYDALKKYKPKKYLENFKLSGKELMECRDAIFLSGYNIDPMAKWYPFIRTIRLADEDKFKLIEKETLLAHDFYILAEILTFFYRDAVGIDILDPEDIFDGRAGKWKFKNCQECNREMRVKNHREKYCSFCKKKIVERNGVTSKCYKCKKPFYKYVDGDEMVNKPFNSNRKPKMSSFDTVTKVKLYYGKVVVYTQCECGALNYETIEKGWL